MLIHPNILYTFYVFYINDIFLNFLKKKNQEKKKFFYRNTFLILSSITLGSWWAEQELSWGG
jgi:cytochrome c biogenesis factor